MKYKNKTEREFDSGLLFEIPVKIPLNKFKKIFKRKKQNK